MIAGISEHYNAFIWLLSWAKRGVRRSRVLNWDWNRRFASKQTERQQMTQRQNQVHIFIRIHTALTFWNEDIHDCVHSRFPSFFLALCVFSFMMNTSISNWSSNIDCFMFICHRIRTGCSGWLVLERWLSRLNIHWVCIRKQFHLLAPSLKRDIASWHVSNRPNVCAQFQFSLSKLTMATLKHIN